MSTVLKAQNAQTATHLQNCENILVTLTKTKTRMIVLTISK